LRTIDDFGLKNQTKSRETALAKLRRAFGDAIRLQWVDIDKPPVACWTFFKPRSAAL
jgi:hypothetical protein